MIVAGVDFETNGAELKDLKVTECGASLVDLSDYREIDTLSTLVYDESYPAQPEHIIELTGITDEMLKMDGIPPREMLERLNLFLSQAEYAIAYNRLFDENVYREICFRENITPVEIVWICAYTEVPYPDKFTCRKLSHLALDHGIPMDGRALHRAIDDVRGMFDLLKKYPFDRILAYAKEPWIFVQAIIPPPWTDGGAGKAAATKRGYGWERARGTDKPVFSKMWVKRIKEGQLNTEIKDAPFTIAKLNGYT